MNNRQPRCALLSYVLAVFVLLALARAPDAEEIVSPLLFEAPAPAANVNTALFDSPLLFDPPVPAASFQTEVFGAGVDFELPTTDAPSPTKLRALFSNIVSDHEHFYDPETLAWLAVGVGAHAVVSNTHADEFLQHEWQENIRNARTDEWSELFQNSKIFGEGTYLLPAYAVAALAAIPFEQQSPMGVAGEWGERSLRTVLVGAPPMLGLQSLIGASRPGEDAQSSHWDPFQDNNSLSGHAFMGAVPFLSAARMTERRGLKALLYAASTMPGLSRINDDAHYASQSILGWGVAFLASGAVNDTYQLPGEPTMLPGPVADGEGMNLMWKF